MQHFYLDRMVGRNIVVEVDWAGVFIELSQSFSDKSNNQMDILLKKEM